MRRASIKTLCTGRSTYAFIPCLFFVLGIGERCTMLLDEPSKILVSLHLVYVEVVAGHMKLKRPSDCRVSRKFAAPFPRYSAKHSVLPGLYLISRRCMEIALLLSHRVHRCMSPGTPAPNIKHRSSPNTMFMNSCDPLFPTRWGVAESIQKQALSWLSWVWMSSSSKWSRSSAFPIEYAALKSMAPIAPHVVVVTAF